MSTTATPTLDEAKVGSFVNQIVGELGAALNVALVVIGDELGSTGRWPGRTGDAGELAERTGTSERYTCASG